MSAVIGVKRLQQLINGTWAAYPGGEIPQAGRIKDDWGGIVAARLYTGQTIHIDVCINSRNDVVIEVHKRSSPLTWGREVFEQERLEETALAFQRAAHLKGLANAKKALEAKR